VDNKFFPSNVFKSTKQVHVCLCKVYILISSPIRQAYIQTFFHIARFKEDQHTFERKKGSVHLILLHCEKWKYAPIERKHGQPWN